MKKKTKNDTPPHRRRRRPKLLRVTLSPAAGQHIQRPPASGRDLTLHQRPGTIFLRPHCYQEVRLTTVAQRSRWWNLLDSRRLDWHGLERHVRERFATASLVLSTPVTIRPPVDWLDGWQVSALRVATPPGAINRSPPDAVGELCGSVRT